MKRTAQETKEWMGNALNKSNEFMEYLLQVYGNSIAILDRIQIIVELWEDFHDHQDKITLCLHVLQDIPKQTLVEGKMMEVNQAYDFHCWYCVLIFKRDVLEKEHDDCKPVN